MEEMERRSKSEARLAKGAQLNGRDGKEETGGHGSQERARRSR